MTDCERKLANVDLNIFVVRISKRVEYVKIKVIGKLHKLSTAVQKKVTKNEVEKQKYERKSNNYLNQVSFLKTMHNHDIAKLVILVQRSLDDVFRDHKSSVEERSLVRIVEDEGIRTAIKELRAQYPNLSKDALRAIKGIGVNFRAKGMKRLKREGKLPEALQREKNVLRIAHQLQHAERGVKLVQKADQMSSEPTPSFSSVSHDEELGEQRPSEAKEPLGALNGEENLCKAKSPPKNTKPKSARCASLRSNSRRKKEIEAKKGPGLSQMKAGSRKGICAVKRLDLAAAGGKVDFDDLDRREEDDDDDSDDDNPSVKKKRVKEASKKGRKKAKADNEEDDSDSGFSFTDWSKKNEGVFQDEDDDKDNHLDSFYFDSSNFKEQLYEHLPRSGTFNDWLHWKGRLHHMNDKKERDIKYGIDRTPTNPNFLPIGDRRIKEGSRLMLKPDYS